jgi:hypothetical protein
MKAIAQRTLKELYEGWRYAKYLSEAIVLKVHPDLNHSLLFLSLLNAYP